MGGRAQDPAGAREGAHPPAGPDRPGAPRVAMGAHREELRVRHRRGPAHARRAVRRPPPAHGAALHARPGLGPGLPELLLHGRPHRRHERAPGATRRHAAGRVARATGRNRALSPAHGLEVQVGVVERQRLQPRLLRELHAGAAGPRRGLLQLRRAPLHGRGAARHQRVLQGRRGRHVPHLLHLRTRRGSDDGHLRHARPRAQGPRRARRAQQDGVGAPPRPLRGGAGGRPAADCEA